MVREVITESRATSVGISTLSRGCCQNPYQGEKGYLLSQRLRIAS